MAVKKNKRNMVILAVAALAVTMSAFGVGLAVLTKTVESRANNFSFEDIEVALEEPHWPPKDPVVYPGRVVSKDPQVVNKGETDIYVYLEVKVPKGSVRSITNGELKDAAEQDLLSFQPNSGWIEIERRTETIEDSEQNYSVYLYAYNAVLESKATTNPPLFDEVKFLDVIEGELEAEMILEMPISVYAIQTDYLDNVTGTIEDKLKSAYELYIKNADD